MSEGVLPAARKICLIKADRIGDIVLLSGYLRYLAESLPEARLDLHVAPDMLDLAPLLHPRVNVAALPFSRHLDVADTELASWL